jgi:hypothetical protein
MLTSTLHDRIWYNYILTVLFSTLLDDAVKLRDGITPKTVVAQASETITFLVGVYQERYGFLSIHPFLPHMVYTAAIAQLRLSPSEESLREAAIISEKGGTGKRNSEPLTPTTGCARGIAGTSRRDTHPLGNPFYHPPHVSEPVRPSWKQHIVPGTLRHSGILPAGTNSNSDGASWSSSSPYHVWPQKSASNWAAEATLYLTKMGITNRKAAELARVLREKGITQPPPASSLPRTSQTSSSLWMPGWESVNWGDAGDGISAGFGGLGVESLQGFAALTGADGVTVPVTSQQGMDVRQYVPGHGGGAFESGPTGLSAGIGVGEASGVEGYGGLYIHSGTLPQGGCEDAFGGYGGATIDCLGVNALSDFRQRDVCSRREGDELGSVSL